MKVYISNIEEKDKYLKILTSMTRGDFLYLLHADDQDSIPLSTVNFFQQAKGTIQFLGYDKSREDLNKAFIYGKLSNQYDHLILCTDDPIFNQIMDFNGSNTKKKEDKTQSEEKQEKSERNSSPVQEVPIPEKTSNQYTENPIYQDAGNRTKYKNEEEYKKLRSLCLKLSTSEISLCDYIPQIIRAVEKAISESEAFSSSLMMFCKNDVADQIEDAFVGYEPELFSIIENLNVED